jgi:catechol 2,3-dioxygenase-like lactoylglutathione lyase family enzyme
MDAAPHAPFRNREFAIDGINHFALVCSDVDRTVAFYSGVLGMPLVKDITLPDGSSRHFFFGLGNGDCLAFFYFAGGPPRAPGVAAAGALPGVGDLTSAVGSMNHVAFTVPEERFDEYCQRLRDKGVEVSPVLNHDDSAAQVARAMHDGVFVRSIYFMDPDGILLEFACWTNDGTQIAAGQRRGVVGED